MPINASPEQRAEICKKNTEVLKSVLLKYKFSSIELCDFVDDELTKEMKTLLPPK